MSTNHVLLKWLVDYWFTLSIDQFILFDIKSFVASPEADIESVHLFTGGWAATHKYTKDLVWGDFPGGYFKVIVLDIGIQLLSLYLK